MVYRIESSSSLIPPSTIRVTLFHFSYCWSYSNICTTIHDHARISYHIQHLLPTIHPSSHDTLRTALYCIAGAILSTFLPHKRLFRFPTKPCVFSSSTTTTTTSLDLVLTHSIYDIHHQPIQAAICIFILRTLPKRASRQHLLEAKKKKKRLHHCISRYIGIGYTWLLPHSPTCTPPARSDHAWKQLGTLSLSISLSIDC
jgi:hypothetical protein